MQHHVARNDPVQAGITRFFIAAGQHHRGEALAMQVARQALATRMPEATIGDLAQAVRAGVNCVQVRIRGHR